MSVFQSDWQALRTSVTSSDTALAASTKDVSSVPGDAIELANGTIGVEIIGFATAAADKYFDYVIYAGRSESGPAVKVCSGRMTTGLMQVNQLPQGGTATASSFYVDTITVSNTWRTQAKAVNAAEDVAQLTLDTRGYQWILCEITISGGEATAASLSLATW
jgi:hypothetical protein